jgi:DNA (cytosine-5)-methyltransferase 1
MTDPLRVLDLFSGIGGFSLGLERTGGFKTVAFCEIEPFCQRVLAKHWPKVPIYDDIRELTGARLAADGIAVDVICGGFPCQDISFAGKRAGLEGSRSGLWSEYGRLIGELRPRFVIVENVPGLLSLGMATVLGDLSALRYDAVWDCVPAAAVGAPHRRDRVWLIAHPQHPDADIPGLHRTGLHEHRGAELRDEQECEPGSFCEDVANPGRQRGAVGGRHQDLAGTPRAGQADGAERQRHGHAAHDSSATVADSDGSRLPTPRPQPNGTHRINGRGVPAASGWWSTEPDVGRVAHGVPSRVDRLRSLGNAVVPQIPELIGKAILEAEGGC